MDIIMNAILVKEAETSTPSSPKSVCYRLSVTNPKFVGLAAALNRIAAKASAKLNIQPMISTKEKVEKLIAEYNPDAGLEIPLAEVTYSGFDYNKKYDASEHTNTDVAKEEEALKLVHKWWMSRMDPKANWAPIDDLDLDVTGISTYDAGERCGKAMAHCTINATPKQVMAYFADRRNSSNLDGDVLESTYTTSTELLPVPVGIATISDREILYRSVFVRNDEEESYTNVGYSIEDDRRPIEKGKVRMEQLFV
jgi:hypothetical protein